MGSTSIRVCLISCPGGEYCVRKLWVKHGQRAMNGFFSGLTLKFIGLTLLYAQGSVARWVGPFFHFRVAAVDAARFALAVAFLTPIGAND